MFDVAKVDLLKTLQKMLDFLNNGAGGKIKEINKAKKQIQIVSDKIGDNGNEYFQFGILLVLISKFNPEAGLDSFIILKEE